MANGPGRRSVVWTQGCTLGCAGCFNPATHAAGPADTDVGTLATQLLAHASDGVTLTGGEPFQQWNSVKALLQEIRSASPLLSILVFTGFTLKELRASHEDADEMLDLIDVLIAGRYNDRIRGDVPLIGSRNQQAHLLSRKHDREELNAVPMGEIIIGPTGTITVTGVAPAALMTQASGGTSQ